MSPDAPLDLEPVLACLAALAGVGGLLAVLAGLERRLSTVILVAGFLLLLTGGALGVPGTPLTDAHWSELALCAGTAGLVLGVILTSVGARARQRAQTKAAADMESMRREVERLGGTNVRLEDELRDARVRLVSFEKNGSGSDASRAAREAGAVRQRKAVEVAQASERKYRTIFDGALEGMAMLERETLRLMNVNPSLCRMTGFDPAELGTRTLVDLFAAGPSQPGKADLQRTAREGRSITVEVQRKDGGTTWADVSISVIGVGTDAQLLTVVRDVSERRLLEQEVQLHIAGQKERERRLEDANRELADRTAAIERMNDRLHEMQDQKDHFVSTVSHELRTPLTSIRSFSEILLKHAETEPEIRREFLTIINKESERLTRLVNNVLDLARIESGESRLELTEFDVREVVADAVYSMAGMAEERAIRLVCETGPSPRLFCGDRDKIQQLVMNLVSNAIKFSPVAGDVTIDVRDSGKPRFTEICVADQGRGIAAEELERVFEKFRRAEDASANEIPGTGLGLAICREIAKIHGGRIWAESDGAKGSSFRVELPGLEESRRVHSSPRPAAKPAAAAPAKPRETKAPEAAAASPWVPVLTPEPPTGPQPVAASADKDRTGGRGVRDWSKTGSLPPLMFPSRGGDKTRERGTATTGELPPIR